MASFGATASRCNDRNCIAIDYVGMAFVVAAALVQTVVDDVAYGLLAIALGTLLAAWGAVSRVRAPGTVRRGDRCSSPQ